MGAFAAQMFHMAEIFEFSYYDIDENPITTREIRELHPFIKN